MIYDVKNKNESKKTKENFFCVLNSLTKKTLTKGFFYLSLFLSNRKTTSTTTTTTTSTTTSTTYILNHGVCFVHDNLIIETYYILIKN